MRRRTTTALTLLILGVAGAHAADPNPPAPDAVKMLEKLKAVVQMTKDGDVLSYRVNFYGSVATDADLKLLAGLKPLSSVMLGQNNTDAGLDELAAVADLPALDLRDTKITVRGIRKLAGWSKLTDLGLYGGATDDWLAEMAGIPNLQNLTVFSSDVTKEGLRRLADCKNLRRFVLDAHVDDAALKNLVGCKELRSLYIHNLVVNGDAAGVRDLADAPKLNELGLESIQFKGAHMEQFAALKQVRSLSVAGVFIGDDAVPGLSQLTWLESLDVFTTRITKAGVEKLRKALPKCKVQSPP